VDLKRAGRSRSHYAERLSARDAVLQSATAVRDAIRAGEPLPVAEDAPRPRPSSAPGRTRSRMRRKRGGKSERSGRRIADSVVLVCVTNDRSFFC